MTQFLQKVLATDEPLFVYGLSKLEKSTGNDGVDTRLIADMTHGAHAVMRTMGLDTADTTGHELYQALISSVANGTAETFLLESDYYLLPYEDKAISFNLIDVIENAHHELSYENQTSTHGQRSLRGEIVKRYLDHVRTNETATIDIAKSIGLIEDEGAMVESDKLTIPISKDRPYLLTIGDIVTDAFIALREDEAEVTTDENGAKRLSMEFGSKPPYDHVDIIQAVGNSANAAVAFSRLGLSAGLLAFVGNDQAGHDSVKYLNTEKVNTELVSIQDGQKSNYHYALRYGADRTILIKYENYAYDWKAPSLVPDWIYLSMISKDSWQLHEDLISYLDQYEATKLAFQPGTFHFEWGSEKLARIYERSHLVVMNREEAALVTGNKVDSITTLVNALHDLGPKIVIITDGPSGAYASDGEKTYVMPNYPDPAKPYDRTGAGDAFASTIVAALAKGKSLQTALLWAPINSMSVVQVLGAQAGLLKQTDIETYLKSAPKEYHPEEYTE